MVPPGFNLLCLNGLYLILSYVGDADCFVLGMRIGTGWATYPNLWYDILRLL